MLRAELLSNTSGATVVTDPRTLLFAGVAALLAGLLTGLAPIFQTGRADLTRDLKAGTREGAVHRSRTRVALLLLQGALSVVLLVGAGLFVRSLRNVQQVHLGYDSGLGARRRHADARRAARQRAQRRAAAAAPRRRRSDAGRGARVPTDHDAVLEHVEHGPPRAGIDSVDRLGEFDLNAVSADYFATMGTRLLRGRGITDQDVAGAPLVMVVSDAMARVLWPGRDALGECVRVGGDTVPCTTVVGVAENIKSRSLSDDPGFFYYLSSAQANPDIGRVVRPGARLRAAIPGDYPPAAAAVDAGCVVRHRHAPHRCPGRAGAVVAARGDDVHGVRSCWRWSWRRSASTA